MTSDITFGDVQHAEPTRGLRPDQDAHFCVVAVGELANFRPAYEANSEARSKSNSRSNSRSNSETGADPSQSVLGGVAADGAFHIDADGDAFNNHTAEPADGADLGKRLPDDELPIYVDLDVMRAMEAHASSNTNVELGGVMMGFQQIDEDGRPFVVVSEWIKAEHYEATKGRFKFTHETWSQIGERRKQLDNDLEMVGWYHTHPGWRVFLSGMDDFICDHYFNRELDIALVIDPVNDDRGWFQWATVGDRRKTRRTLGFYLTTNRFRESELRFFANVYSGGQAMNFDPRYSDSQFSGGGQPVVNISDNRRPMFDFAVLAMLSMQFLFLSLIAWKILIPTGNGEARLSEVLAAEAQQEILETIVNKQTGKDNLVDRYAKQRLANTRLAANLDGQVLRSEVIKKQLLDAEKLVRDKDKQIAKSLEKQKKLDEDNVKLGKQVTKLGGTVDLDGFDWSWVYYSLAGLMAIGMGATGGFFMARRRQDFYEEEPRRRPRDPAPAPSEESGARMTTNEDSEGDVE